MTTAETITKPISSGELSLDFEAASRREVKKIPGLTLVEAYVLYARGHLQEAEFTYDDIGTLLGVGPARARQIEQQALMRLRNRTELAEAWAVSAA